MTYQCQYLELPSSILPNDSCTFQPLMLSHDLPWIIDLIFQGSSQRMETLLQVAFLHLESLQCALSHQGVTFRLLNVASNRCGHVHFDPLDTPNDTV
mmetsp:Transcript_40394/g.121693  ORF Transcript_40394/g.121693 Transcript_40394/m.121693 type:complete len:97 (+) Transcript_40394:5946-6236(+)